jgi:hypothetical protein
MGAACGDVQEGINSRCLPRPAKLGAAHWVVEAQTKQPSKGVRIEFECWSLAVQGCRAGPSAVAVATLLRQLFNLRAPQTIACIQSAPPYALVLLLLLLLLLLLRQPSSSLLA